MPNRGWRGGPPRLLLLGLLLCIAPHPAGATGFDLTGLRLVDSFTLDGGSTGDPTQDPTIVVGDVAYFDWDVDLVMGFDGDLSQYTVEATADGIRITGPFESPGWAKFVLSFNVATLSGEILASAALETGVEASTGGFAGVMPENVIERVGHTTVASLQATVAGLPGTASGMLDLTPLGQDNLRIRKTIVADFDGEPGTQFARVLYVDQAFTSVPEPGALALMGLGLGGLALVGRSRRD